MGEKVDMNHIMGYKQMNDALETINEMKIGLNDNLLEKALTEGKARVPFDFDQGIIIFWNKVEDHNLADADADVTRMKQKLRGKLASSKKVVAPWLN